MAIAADTEQPPHRRRAPPPGGRRGGSGEDLRRSVSEIANRHPAVGLAVGVVREGRLAAFAALGLADVATRRPIDERTVFRIASVTKLFTAVAVMQLVERGLVDLDAPVNDALRAYRLVPARGVTGVPTVRHLLTHTSGVPEVVRMRDLLHPSWGSFGYRPVVHSVAVGEPIPSLAEVYRGRLAYVSEPGRAFSYSNHGFATLGQIVEDVSGQTWDRYVREHLLEPLGMADTSPGRSSRTEPRRATGYEIGPRGPIPVVDREWVSRGASALSSTVEDLARFAAALLPSGTGGRSILSRGSLAAMMDPHWQPHRAVPGMGLGFFRGEVGGHRTVYHDGRVPGFVAMLLLAPDDGAGIIGITNGAPGAPTWLPSELEGLLAAELGVSPAGVRHDLPHRPDVWPSVIGRYGLTARVSDLRGRLVLGGGVDVLVRGGQLVGRLRLPVPAAWRGVPLHPDDAEDPLVFRADLAPFGMGTARLAFSGDAVHTDLGCLSLDRVPARRGVGRGVAIAAAVAGTALVAARRRRVRR